MGIKLSEGPDQLVAFSTVPLAGWLQIVAFCGLIESTGFTFAKRESIGQMFAKLKALLASGHLAIMAIIRMLFQDGFTGSAAKSKRGRFSL